MLKNTYELYEDMSDAQLMDLGLTNEELSKIYFDRAKQYAITTLQFDENCYNRFGVKLLTEAQEIYFRKIANDKTPTDDEQVTVDMDTVKQLRESEMREAAKLGKDYTPTLSFVDKTNENGFSC